MKQWEERESYSLPRELAWVMNVIMVPCCSYCYGKLFFHIHKKGFGGIKLSVLLLHKNVLFLSICNIWAKFLSVNLQHVYVGYTDSSIWIVGISDFSTVLAIGGRAWWETGVRGFGFQNIVDVDLNIDPDNPPVIKEAADSHPHIVISHQQLLTAHCSTCCHPWFSSLSSYEGVLSIYYAAHSQSQWDGRMLPDQFSSQEAGLIYFLRICLRL